MKNYKDYQKVSIGSSDIASLVLVGISESNLKAEFLHFAGDGEYQAYIVDNEAEIGAHYEKMYTFTHWMKVYDDEELMHDFNAREINVYRAGDFGCIVQLIE